MYKFSFVKEKVESIAPGRYVVDVLLEFVTITC